MAQAAEVDAADPMLARDGADSLERPVRTAQCRKAQPHGRATLPAARVRFNRGYNCRAMSLPILKTTVQSTPESLVRLYHQTQVQWTRHTSEETQLDCGTAMHNAELPHVFAANRVLEAALPPGVSPEVAFDEAESHFRSLSCTCSQWVMNPSASREQKGPLVEHLLSNGFAARTDDIMHLAHLPNRAIEGTSVSGLTIIPARASFKHARALIDEWSRPSNTPGLTDARMMHLDDPHYDALLALRDGAPAAHVGVLAMGEVGVIKQLYVSEAFRGQGIATVMMSRALEICARSLFKQILLAVAPANARAIAVYRKFGFAKVGDVVEYQRACAP
jgi:GNAT superfamily N-acetyltransferase